MFKARRSFKACDARRGRARRGKGAPCALRSSSNRSNSVASPPATASRSRRCANTPPRTVSAPTGTSRHDRQQGDGRPGPGVHRGDARVGAGAHHAGLPWGSWTEEQRAFAKRLVALIEYGGGVPGIQVAHAGRKGSSQRPWEGGKALRPEDGGWVPWGPSPIAFHDNGVEPHAMSEAEIHDVVDQFAETARLSLEAGFKVIELHGAHGYLLHAMLSPLSNRRNDALWRRLKCEAAPRMLMEVTSRRLGASGRGTCRFSCVCPARIGPRAV